MEVLTYIILIAIVLGLSSLTVRDVIKYKGKKLTIYLFSIFLSITFGALIASKISTDSDYTYIGAMIGLAAVKIGPFVGNAVKDFFKNIGKLLPKAITNKLPSIFQDQSINNDDLSGK